MSRCHYSKGQNTMKYQLEAICGILFFLGMQFGMPSDVLGGYVIPQLGGGQVGMGTAPMKHADITLVGNSLVVHLDDTVPTPILRPLTAPDEFDPAMPWGVLGDKSHNFQYGWNPSGFWAPPVGAGIWIEEIAASPELEVYFVDGLPVSPPYDPIFGTANSSTKWKWSGSMTHNAYAVENPMRTEYEATYKVYIGDEITGTEIVGYQSAEVTFHFTATPLLTADFNSDTRVDDNDLAIWQQSYAIVSGALNSQGDTDGDGDVDGRDFLTWQRQFTGVAAPLSEGAPFKSVPEPSAVSLAASLLLLFFARTKSRR